jgi:hypothetical protein
MKSFRHRSAPRPGSYRSDSFTREFRTNWAVAPYEPAERVTASSKAHEATVYRPLFELLDSSQYRTESFGAANVGDQADALVAVLLEYATPFMQALTKP